MVTPPQGPSGRREHDYRFRQTTLLEHISTNEVLQALPHDMAPSQAKHVEYGGTAPKFCMFHKAGWLPLPPVEHTKLRVNRIAATTPPKQKSIHTILADRLATIRSNIQVPGRMFSQVNQQTNSCLVRKLFYFFIIFIIFLLSNFSTFII